MARQISSCAEGLKTFDGHDIGAIIGEATIHYGNRMTSWAAEDAYDKKTVPAYMQSRRLEKRMEAIVKHLIASLRRRHNHLIIENSDLLRACMTEYAATSRLTSMARVRLHFIV